MTIYNRTNHMQVLGMGDHCKVSVSDIGKLVMPEQGRPQGTSPDNGTHGSSDPGAYERASDNNGIINDVSGTMQVVAQGKHSELHIGQTPSPQPSYTLMPGFHAHRPEDHYRHPAPPPLSPTWHNSHRYVPGNPYYSNPTTPTFSPIPQHSPGYNLGHQQHYSNPTTPTVSPMPQHTPGYHLRSQHYHSNPTTLTFSAMSLNPREHDAGDQYGNRSPSTLSPMWPIAQGHNPGDQYRLGNPTPVPAFQPVPPHYRGDDFVHPLGMPNVTEPPVSPAFSHSRSPSMEHRQGTPMSNAFLPTRPLGAGAPDGSGSALVTPNPPIPVLAHTTTVNTSVSVTEPTVAQYSSCASPGVQSEATVPRFTVPLILSSSSLPDQALPSHVVERLDDLPSPAIVIEHSAPVPNSAPAPSPQASDDYNSNRFFVPHPQLNTTESSITAIDTPSCATSITDVASAMTELANKTDSPDGEKPLATPDSHSEVSPAPIPGKKKFPRWFTRTIRKFRKPRKEQ